MSRDDTSVGYPSEWARDVLPNQTPEWDAAIAYGIDVSLLAENLKLTPAQRFERHAQLVAFHEVLRAARPVR